MQRIFDEGFATGDGSVADQVCAPGLVDHQFGLAGTGAEAIQHLKDAIADVHRAVPDICFTIEDSAEQGDAIRVRVRGRGTATGPFFGPPSNRPVDFTVIDVARIVDGRIINLRRAGWSGDETTAPGQLGDGIVVPAQRISASGEGQREISGRGRDRSRAGRAVPGCPPRGPRCCPGRRSGRPARCR